MRKRNYPRNAAPAALTHAQTTAQWPYVLLTIICVVFLAFGFFFAARQHFSAMDLGIKNSKLRSQIEDLQGEQRRLVLAREVVRAPGEIKRIARSRGFRESDGVGSAVFASTTDASPNGLVAKTVMSNDHGGAVATKPVKAFFATASAPAAPANSGPEARAKSLPEKKLTHAGSKENDLIAKNR